MGIIFSLQLSKFSSKTISFWQDLSVNENADNMAAASEYFEFTEEDYSNESPIETRSTKQPLGIKRKREKSPESKRQILLEKAIGILDRKQNEGAEDAEDIFGKYIVQQLRTSEARDRNYLKFKIQELIFNYQFGQLVVPPSAMSQTSVLLCPSSSLTESNNFATVVSPQNKEATFVHYLNHPDNEQ